MTVPIGRPTIPQEPEKTIEIDGALQLLLEWKEADQEARVAKAKADRLAEQFKTTMTSLGATQATVLGTKVMVCRRTETFQGALFAKERPDMNEQYTRPVLVDKLNTEALRGDHPELYRRYQAVTLRPSWKALETALATTTKVEDTR
jgi:hypothetical protein